MNDELTQIDIDQMKNELEERRILNKKLIEEVQAARELGDLSENDEYRSAKRELNRNKSRMRYLNNMISTAVIITTDSAEDEVGLFDKVEIYYPDDDETATVRIVTTLRNDVFSDNISKESPFGKALMGKHVGDEVRVQVNENMSYPVKILSITKGEDDPDLPISTY